jgi:hypothetical protein
VRSADRLVGSGRIARRNALDLLARRRIEDANRRRSDRKLHIRAYP